MTRPGCGVPWWLVPGLVAGLVTGALVTGALVTGPVAGAAQ